MEFTITIYGWMIPLIITFVSITVAFSLEKPTGSIGDGIMTVVYLVPALAISCASWVLYALLK